MTGPGASPTRPDVPGSRARRRVGGRDVAIVAGAVLAGLAIGVFVRYADSLPPDQRFLGTAARLILGIGGFVAVVAALMRFAAGSALSLIATVAFGAGVLTGYPFGPAVSPAVTVGGSYELTLTGIDGTARGTPECEWAAARARIGQLRFPALAFRGGEARLVIDFFGVRTTLEAPGSVYRWTGPDAVLPLEPEVPAYAPDGSTGAIRLFMTRADVPDPGEEDEPVELAGTLRWTCEGAPPS